MKEDIISIIKGLNKQFELYDLVQVLKKKYKSKYDEYLKLTMQMIQDKDIIRLQCGKYRLGGDKNESVY